MTPEEEHEIDSLLAGLAKRPPIADAGFAQAVVARAGRRRRRAIPWVSLSTCTGLAALAVLAGLFPDQMDLGVLGTAVKAITADPWLAGALGVAAAGYAWGMALARSSNRN